MTHFNVGDKFPSDGRLTYPEDKVMPFKPWAVSDKPISILSTEKKMSEVLFAMKVKENKIYVRKP